MRLATLSQETPEAAQRPRWRRRRRLFWLAPAFTVLAAIAASAFLELR